MGIEWKESFSIGVDEVDNQHKELLRHFDGLLVACEKGQGRDEVKRLYSFLDSYVVHHFRSEEAIQQQYEYPGYAVHKQEHDNFINRIKTMEEKIVETGDVEVAHLIETNNLMLEWLIKHISYTDMELGKFMRSRQSA